MPPETGLPLARSNGVAASNRSATREEHQPATHSSARENEFEPETLHG